MRPLVDEMVKKDPGKRPTMDAIVAHFAKIQSTLSDLKLRSRVARRDEYTVVWLVREMVHWARQLYYIAEGQPPLGRAVSTAVDDSATASAVQ